MADEVGADPHEDDRWLPVEAIESWEAFAEQCG
jgi:hypothetical protein